MKYAYKRTLESSFEEALVLLKTVLLKEGFGVLYEINLREKLKEKTGKDIGKYVIIGACNPVFASRALEIERAIGVFLPCNVVLYEQNGAIVVATVQPEALMASLGSSELEALGSEVGEKLQMIINKL